MKDFFHPPSFLTDRTDRLGVLLTLFFFAVFPIHALSAGDPYSPRYASAMDASEQSAQRNAIITYARQEATNWVPNLSDTFRGPATWALSGFQATRNLFDFGLSSLDDDGVSSTDAHAVTRLMPPTATHDDDNAWLASTTYHHHNGILPTHDAMMMGAHAQQGLLDHYMKIDLHPYYAQNWFSERGYYGTELALNLASPADTESVSKPWGKIVLGYTNGDERLTDHGRGINLHGELRISDTISLNSGVRQNDLSDTGNYVLLQWKLITE